MLALRGILGDFRHFLVYADCIRIEVDFESLIQASFFVGEMFLYTQ